MIQGVNNLIKTQRLVTSGGKEEYPDGVFILEDVGCYLEPIAPEVAAILDDQAAYIMFKCYFNDEEDVKIGDLLTDAQDNTYTVKGVMVFKDNTDFTEPYTELTLVKKYDAS